MYKKIILKKRKEAKSVLFIVNFLKKESFCEGWSIILILFTVLSVFKDNNLHFSKQEVEFAFNKVPKKEYAKIDYNKILDNLLKK